MEKFMQSYDVVLGMWHVLAEDLYTQVDGDVIERAEYSFNIIDSLVAGLSKPNKMSLLVLQELHLHVPPSELIRIATQCNSAAKPDPSLDDFCDFWNEMLVRLRYIGWISQTTAINLHLQVAACAKLISEQASSDNDTASTTINDFVQEYATKLKRAAMALFVRLVGAACLLPLCFAAIIIAVCMKIGVSQAVSVKIGGLVALLCFVLQIFSGIWKPTPRFKPQYFWLQMSKLSYHLIKMIRNPFTAGRLPRGILSASIGATGAVICLVFVFAIEPSSTRYQFLITWVSAFAGFLNLSQLWLLLQVIAVWSGVVLVGALLSRVTVGRWKTGVFLATRLLVFVVVGSVAFILPFVAGTVESIKQAPTILCVVSFVISIFATALLWATVGSANTHIAGSKRFRVALSIVGTVAALAAALAMTLSQVTAEIDTSPIFNWLSAQMWLPLLYVYLVYQALSLIPVRETWWPSIVAVTSSFQTEFLKDVTPFFVFKEFEAAAKPHLSIRRNYQSRLRCASSRLRKGKRLLIDADNDLIVGFRQTEISLTQLARIQRLGDKRVEENLAFHAKEPPNSTRKRRAALMLRNNSHSDNPEEVIAAARATEDWQAGFDVARLHAKHIAIVDPKNERRLLSACSDMAAMGGFVKQPLEGIITELCASFLRANRVETCGSYLEGFRPYIANSSDANLRMISRMADGVMPTRDEIVSLYAIASVELKGLVLLWGSRQALVQAEEGPSGWEETAGAIAELAVETDLESRIAGLNAMLLLIRMRKQRENEARTSGVDRIAEDENCGWVTGGEAIRLALELSEEMKTTVYFEPVMQNILACHIDTDVPLAEHIALGKLKQLAVDSENFEHAAFCSTVLAVNSTDREIRDDLLFQAWVSVKCHFPQATILQQWALGNMTDGL